MKFYFHLLALTLSINAFSQRNMYPGATGGSITGKIVDGATDVAIEFSNIALFNKADSSLALVVSSATDGSFSLEGVKKGNYKLRISFVGYKTRKIDSVQVMGFKPVDMGVIKLNSNSENLEDVVVTGQRNAIESKIDRKIFYVDKNIAAQSGTATDVLQQVPSVQVDADGNVSLRGSDNVNVMVNGKPSMIDKAILLQQISANSIEKIEVITNPSAKYDPDGTSGIINIVLKQGMGQGTNAVTTVNVGTKDKYNGSLNLNYNPGKLNLFANYSYRNETRGMNGWSDKTVFVDSSMHHEISKSTNTNESHLAKIGFDYNATEKITFGSNASINTGNRKEDGTNAYEDIDTLVHNWYRGADNSEDNLSEEFGAYVTNKFDKNGHEIKLEYTLDNENENSTNYYDDYSLRNGATFNKLLLDNINYKNSNKERENSEGGHLIHTIQADYTLPVNETNKLELGAKSILRKNTDVADFESSPSLMGNDWVKDLFKSNEFHYDEDIHAVYGTYSLTQGKFSAMAGLRFEQAYTRFNDTVEEHKNYTSLFPTLHTAYKLNDNNEITASYSRRINRPNGRMLNPFPDYSNAQNLRIGNPDLKPEYINSLEAGYTYKIEKVTFQPTIFYRITEDAITRNADYDTIKKVTIMSFYNANNNSSYGAEMAITYQPLKFWNINFSASAYQFSLDAANINNTVREKFSYNGKIMSNTFLPLGFAFNISAFYRSPFITPTGTSKPFYSTNLGLKKDFLKGKLTGTFTWSDIFDTMHFEMTQEGLQQSSHMYRKRESQTIFLGFTYKFGKVSKNNKKTDNNRNDNGSDDMMF